MPLKRPTTTPMPDEIFDDWAPQLGEAEIKVLLYIVRRTLGFRKDADAISLNQFLKGVVTRDGRVLDHGCGVTSRPNVVRALKSLEAKGLICTAKRHTVDGDHDVTSYSLHWDCDPESDGRRRGSSEMTPPWCRNDQEVVLKENHRGVAATPTTNSVPTNRQQDRETTPASPPLRKLSPRVKTPASEARPPHELHESDAAASWRAVLDDLAQIMTPENYALWLADTTVGACVGQTLTVRVPSAMQCRWLDLRLRRQIERAMGRCGRPDLSVTFEVAP